MISLYDPRGTEREATDGSELQGSPFLQGCYSDVRAVVGVKAFDAARDTLAGVELMHMIKKRQMVVEEVEGRTAAEQFSSLAA
jgi:hypothetical protein